MKVVESGVCTNFRLSRKTESGDWSGQCDRFDTITKRLSAHPQNSTADAEDILKAASVSWTQWSCVYALDDFTVDYAIDNDYDNLYHLTEKDWQQLEQTVNGVFPHFNARLSELCKMGHHDYHVCLLIKVGLQPKDIANLTDHSPESVSSTRRRLYIRAFGQKGTPKDWDSVVLSL